MTTGLLISVALAIAGIWLFSFPELYSRLAAFGCILAAGLVLARARRVQSPEARRIGWRTRIAFASVALAGIAVVAMFVSSEDRMRVVRLIVLHFARAVTR